MLADAKGVTEGAVSGLETAAFRVIPSVFPLSVLFGILRRAAGISSPYLAGILGGYPLGAQCVAGMLDEGRTDSERAAWLVCFCNNPGPAFVISGIGQGVFGSMKAGLLLEGSVVAVSGLGYLLTCARRKDTPSVVASEESLVRSLTASVASGAEGMVVLTGYIVLFRALGAVLPIPSAAAGLIEMSGGIFSVKSLPQAAFLLNFGGLCVMAQAMSFFKNGGLAVRYILCKLVLGGLAATLVKICQEIWKFCAV